MYPLKAPRSQSHATTSLVADFNVPWLKAIYKPENTHPWTIDADLSNDLGNRKKKYAPRSMLNVAYIRKCGHF